MATAAVSLSIFVLPQRGEAQFGVLVRKLPWGEIIDWVARGYTAIEVIAGIRKSRHNDYCKVSVRDITLLDFRCGLLVAAFGTYDDGLMGEFGRYIRDRRPEQWLTIKNWVAVLLSEMEDFYRALEPITDELGNDFQIEFSAVNNGYTLEHCGGH